MLQQYEKFPVPQYNVTLATDTYSGTQKDLFTDSIEWTKIPGGMRAHLWLEVDFNLTMGGGGGLAALWSLLGAISQINLHIPGCVRMLTPLTGKEYARMIQLTGLCGHKLPQIFPLQETPPSASGSVTPRLLLPLTWHDSFAPGFHRTGVYKGYPHQDRQINIRMTGSPTDDVDANVSALTANCQIVAACYPADRVLLHPKVYLEKFDITQAKELVQGGNYLRSAAIYSAAGITATTRPNITIDGRDWIDQRRDPEGDFAFETLYQNGGITNQTPSGDVGTIEGLNVFGDNELNVDDRLWFVKPWNRIGDSLQPQSVHVIPPSGTTWTLYCVRYEYWTQQIIGEHEKSLERKITDPSLVKGQNELDRVQFRDQKSAFPLDANLAVPQDVI